MTVYFFYYSRPTCAYINDFVSSYSQNRIGDIIQVLLLEEFFQIVDQELAACITTLSFSPRRL